MTGSSSDASFDIKSNLRPLVDQLKEISPKLATDTRRALRDTGASIIQKQQEILRTEPVGGVVSKTTYSLSMPNRRGGYRSGPKKRTLAGARIISIESQASARGRSTGLRESVAANLTTQVRTPRTGRGASVRVASTRPYWASKALNAKKWRHQAGTSGRYVEQAGNQYFQRGAEAGVVEAREAIFQVVEDAAKLIRTFSVE